MDEKRRDEDLQKEIDALGGDIGLAAAKKLWKSSLDGPGVTQTEFHTLQKAMDENLFTAQAKKWLTEKVTEKQSGTSLYKVIQGVKYDRKALDKAEHLTKDGSISLEDAKLLWKEVEDGNKVTKIEVATIRYIMENNKLTAGAEKYFNTQLAAWKPAKKKRKKSTVPLMLRRLDNFFN